MGMLGTFLAESGVRPRSLERCCRWQPIDLTLPKDFAGYTPWVYSPGTALHHRIAAVHCHHRTGHIVRCAAG